jgi:hypothetical protein
VLALLCIAASILESMIHWNLLCLLDLLRYEKKFFVFFPSSVKKHDLWFQAIAQYYCSMPVIQCVEAASAPAFLSHEY